MRTPIRFLLAISLSLIASVYSRAQTCGVRQQEIHVEAPFKMPAIYIPVFSDKMFFITDFGAVEGGKVMVTEAIRKAILACHDAGGGNVVIPKGQWLTGAIHLLSNVNLHLVEGAELTFSERPEDYLPPVQSSWEGLECFNYSPLIYSFDCTNVALTGNGTITARLDIWKEWFNRPPAHLEALKRLYTMALKGEPVKDRQMADGENHLRPQFIQFNRCRNVLIEDVKIRNSPFWTIHLLLCDGVVIRRVDIKANGHNNDGVDPEMTRNVLIEDCRFDQGDDAISTKSGRDQDGWRLNTPTENIVIRRCEVLRGHELLAIGSELSGGIRNVYAHDCMLRSDENDKPMNLLFIKTNRGRGGFVEDIYFDDVTANCVSRSVLGIETDVGYQWSKLVPLAEERLTTIRRIFVKNIRIQETGIPIRIIGDARKPVQDIFLENITVNRALGPLRKYENVDKVHEVGIKVIKEVPAAATPGA